MYLESFASFQRRVTVPLSGIALSWEKAFQPLLTALSLYRRPVEPGAERNVLKEGREQHSVWPASGSKALVPSWHTTWCL